MIHNFEEYTSKMTYEEKQFIFPEIIKILSLAIGKEKAVKCSDIINEIESFGIVTHIVVNGKDVLKSIRTTPARVRHMIHVLRVSDTIPFLIATSQGYYISNDVEEINTYIQSIDDRIRSIYQIMKALRRQSKNFPNKQTYSQQQLIL